MFLRLVTSLVLVLFFSNSVQAEPVIAARGQCVQLVNSKPGELQICLTERWSGTQYNFSKYKFDNDTFLVRQKIGEKRVAYLSKYPNKQEIKIEVVDRYLDTLEEIKNSSFANGKQALCYTTLNKKNGFCALPVHMVAPR